MSDRDMWTVSAEAVVTMLDRVHIGEDPAEVYADYYGQVDHTHPNLDDPPDELMEAEAWRQVVALATAADTFDTNLEHYDALLSLIEELSE